MENSKNAVFRWWFLTFNNPQEDWRATLNDLKADYCVGQLECGSEGTHHIQAVCWFRVAKRPSFWKNVRCWSKGVSSHDAETKVTKYCQKTQTRLDGPHEYGEKPFKHNSKADWQTAFDLAKAGRFEEINPKILISHFTNLLKVSSFFKAPVQTDQIRGLWIFGNPGLGKSHYARTTYGEPYVKQQNRWWDGYKGEESVLLDDFDTNGSCLSHYLKIWCDKWKCYGEVKGATVPLCHKIFIITSNYLPNQIWTDPTLLAAIERRFIFIEFFEPQKWRDFGLQPGVFSSINYSWLNDCNIEF